MIDRQELAGEPIIAKITEAPGNCAPIGGIKVMTRADGSRPGLRAPKTSTRFTPRASRGDEHLQQLQDGAQELIAEAFSRAGI